MKPPRLLLGLSLLALACSGGNGAQAGKDEKKRKNPGKSGQQEIAATIGDKKITLDEVDRAARAANMPAYQALFDARKAALDEIVRDQLLDLEAGKLGMTREAVLDAEVNQKSPAITDADVQTFFDQNKARMRGQTIEQASPQIRQFLTAQSRDGAMSAMMSKLKDKYAVRIVLDPPRVEALIAETDPYKGPADAEITIIEYSEFQ